MTDYERKKKAREEAERKRRTGSSDSAGWDSTPVIPIVYDAGSGHDSSGSSDSGSCGDTSCGDSGGCGDGGRGGGD